MGEVVDLFSRARIRTSNEGSTQGQSLQRTPIAPAPLADAAQRDFDQIAQQNAALQEKLRKERASANRNVLKSYRIK
jgi:hypothetical protein